MVAIGTSTVSVITSILIIRLSNVSSPLPAWTRLTAFRIFARFMCVRLSPPSKSAVAPSESNVHNSTSNLVADSDVISMDVEGKRPSNDQRDCGSKIDELLHELRKVGCRRRIQNIVPGQNPPGQIIPGQNLPL